MTFSRRGQVSCALIVCVAAMAACGGGQQSPGTSAILSGEVQLPAGNEIAGWTLVAGPDFYEPDNLWEYINGQADFFIDYGFQRVDTAEYRNDGESLSVVVEVYRMGRPQEAFGIFAAERTADDRPAAIGSGAFVGANTLGFWQGSHYVKVTTFEEGPTVQPLMLGMAAEMSSRLPEDGSQLKTLELFPDEGLAAGSERFIPKNFLGQPYLAVVYRVDTVRSGDEMQLFIAEAASPAKALSHFESLAGFYLEREPELASVDASSQPPLLVVDGSSKLVAFQMGHRLAGAMGMQDIESGREAALELAEEISHSSARNSP